MGIHTDPLNRNEFMTSMNIGALWRFHTYLDWSRALC